LGLKVTLMVQLNPCASKLPQVLPVTVETGNLHLHCARFAGTVGVGLPMAAAVNVTECPFFTC